MILKPSILLGTWMKNYIVKYKMKPFDWCGSMWAFFQLSNLFTNAHNMFLAQFNWCDYDERAKRQLLKQSNNIGCSLSNLLPFFYSEFAVSWLFSLCTFLLLWLTQLFWILPKNKVLIFIFHWKQWIDRQVAKHP